MEFMIKKEIPELFYIKSRNGDEVVKTFVRVFTKLKKGKGSKMYCSARYTALLFDNKNNAIELMNKYNTYGAEIVKYDYDKYTPKYIKEGFILEEIEIKNIKCYRFVRK